MIGRDKEKEKLNQLLDETLKGNTKIVFITGEAGLGKTTFVRNWLTELEQPLTAESSCSVPVAGFRVGEVEALQPFADLMQKLGIAVYLRNEKEHVKKLIRDMAPKWMKIIPVVGPMISAGMESFNVYKDKKKAEKEAKDTVGSQEHIFRQYINFLNKLLDAEKDTGIVLFIDDVHWADSSSVNLLFRIANEITEKPLMIISTFRYDEAESTSHPILKVRDELLRYDKASGIELGRLTRKHIEMMIRDRFAKYRSNPELEEWLEKISNGNALFITQYLNTLIEDKHFDLNGTFISSLEKLNIPASINAVIEERINRIDDVLADLLRYASVEGEQFTTLILSKLSEKNILELTEYLRKAEKAGIIDERGLISLSGKLKTTLFGFIHYLFHKDFYTSLSEEEKEYIHKICFEILNDEWEKLKEKDILSQKLLVHAEKCGEYYRAAEVALANALLLWERFAEKESFEMISIVNRNLEKIEEQTSKEQNLKADSLMLEARIHYQKNRYDSSISSLKEAYDIYKTLENKEKYIECLTETEKSIFRKGDYAKSRETSEEALKESIAINFRKGMALSNAQLGYISFSTGDFESAAVKMTTAVEIFRELNDKRNIAATMNQLALVRRITGKYKEAEEMMLDALEIFRESETKLGITSVSINLAVLYTITNRYDEAFKYLKEAGKLYDTIGDLSGQARVLNNLGNIYKMTGEFDKQLECYMKGLQMCEKIGDIDGMKPLLANLGPIYRMKGDYDTALQYMQRSYDLYKADNSYPENQATILTSIGNVYYDLKDFEKALSYFKQSYELSKSIKDFEGEINSQNNIAKALIDLKNFIEAEKLLIESIERSRKAGLKQMEAEALTSLGVLKNASGNKEEARNFMKEGIEIMKKLKSSQVKEWEEELKQISE